MLDIISMVIALGLDPIALPRGLGKFLAICPKNGGGKRLRGPISPYRGPKMEFAKLNRKSQESLAKLAAN